MQWAQPLSVDRLVRDLRDIGIDAGDCVMVHASLRAIGPVEGGAAGVIDALDRAVGPDGTLLMTVGARDDWAWVNERPEADRPRLLAPAEPFDHRSTPADPDIGVLAEVFRQRPGTVSSNHPEGRFAVRGRDADALLEAVPWNDYYGPGSPLHRLVDRRGTVLRLGADIDTVTLYHYAEYLAAVPRKRRARRCRLVKTTHGPEIRWIECLDDEHGIVDHPGDDYFGLILNAYLASGRARRGTVGNAVAELLDAADATAFASAWMAQHLTME